MKNGSFARRALIAVCAAGAAVAVMAPVATAGVYDTSTCSNPHESQNFLSWKDQNWYTPIPGQGNGGFDGAGWTLGDGAQLATTTLPDGSTGQVLDLPSGAWAVSPVSCVTTDYPTARTMVRNVKGAEGVGFYVSYAGDSAWSAPRNTGQLHGKNAAWTASDPVNLQPTKTTGWQAVRVMFVGLGKTSDFQIYDAELDPRMKR